MLIWHKRTYTHLVAPKATTRSPGAQLDRAQHCIPPSQKYWIFIVQHAWTPPYPTPRPSMVTLMLAVATYEIAFCCMFLYYVACKGCQSVKYSVYTHSAPQAQLVLRSSYPAPWWGYAPEVVERRCLSFTVWVTCSKYYLMRGQSCEKRNIVSPSNFVSFDVGCFCVFYTRPKTP